MAPAISTPVGPAPITTKVRKRRRASGESVDSACSRRRRPSPRPWRSGTTQRRLMCQSSPCCEMRTAPTRRPGRRAPHLGASCGRRGARATTSVPAGRVGGRRVDHVEHAVGRIEEVQPSGRRQEARLRVDLLIRGERGDHAGRDAGGELHDLEPIAVGRDGGVRLVEASDAAVRQADGFGEQRAVERRRVVPRRAAPGDTNEQPEGRGQVPIPHEEVLSSHAVTTVMSLV